MKKSHISYGNKPVDGGNLIVEKEEYEAFIQAEPNAEQYLKRLIGAREFINGELRWCLWLKGVSPAVIKGMPLVIVNAKMDLSHFG